MDLLKKIWTVLKGWKTVIFNALVIVAGLAQYEGLVEIIAPQYAYIFVSAVGLANVLLRWATDTGIFQSTPKT